MTDLAPIKQKSIIAYLSSLGYEPKKEGIKTAMYLCPWRGEHDASLTVYKQTNTWNDFGETGSGGSIIELVEKLHNVDFLGALDILKGNDVKCVVQLPPKDEPPPIKIVNIGEITSEWLISYLRYRCISLEVARRYCKQARVELIGKDGDSYRKTMIAFPNLKGGYEFRNRFSKISNSPKYYSEINGGHDRCVLVEGFFDGLSFMEIYKEPTNITLICLNSASFIKYVDFSRFKEVIYLGDQDATGDKILAHIEANVPTKDMRSLFSPYKDLNEFHMRTTSFRNSFINKKLL